MGKPLHIDKKSGIGFFRVENLFSTKYLGIIANHLFSVGTGWEVHRLWMHRWKKSAQHTRLGYQKQVNECLELAQRCLHRYPTDRPDIQDIISELNEMDHTAASHISIATESTVEQVSSYAHLSLISFESFPVNFSFF